MADNHDPGGRVRRKLANDVSGTALFGGTNGEYRYILHRVWDKRRPTTMFVMMNPSVADSSMDDPTVARCQQFARNWGSGRLFVTNTFAYRATDPKQLLKAKDPIGPENDKHILAAARRSRTIVIAYGRPHSSLRQRTLDVCAMLRRHGHQLYALQLNKDGTPHHPLYLRIDVKPFIINNLY
jgi:hypothetical protein